jgi:hypothetical protein
VRRRIIEPFSRFNLELAASSMQEMVDPNMQKTLAECDDEYLPRGEDRA